MLTLIAALLMGCTLPPLRGKVEIGTDAYAVVAADGGGGRDLFIVRGDDGTATAITFTPTAESGARLSPDGGAVVFLRDQGSGIGDQGGRFVNVWVMNLLSGAERELPPTSTPVHAVAWSKDGSRIYGRSNDGYFAWPAPPQVGEPAFLFSSPEADSAFQVLLGSPAFARIAPCPADEASLCAVRGSGIGQVLARGAHSPARWGSDSVAWILGAEIEARPLGDGVARRIQPEPALTEMRGLSYFAGK
ncbi:MAG TPA: hypothetical protein VFS94_02335 [Gemmatimonadales bacterium]|nr:hypothetical protein [Gemmatimonadales bacterium]